MDSSIHIVVNEGEVLASAGPSSVTKKTGRGKSWKEAENTALARAVGSVGFDAIHGADQASDTYWTKIHEAFCSRGGNRDRSVVGWKTICQLSDCCSGFLQG